MTPEAHRTTLRALLAFGAVVFGAFGLAFALFPTAMAALVGVVAETPEARADVAATYGGLEIGVALFLAWCLGRGAFHEGFAMAALGFGGLGGVRLAYLLAGGGGALSWALVSAEAVGCVLAVWGARRAAGPGARGPAGPGARPARS